MRPVLDQPISQRQPHQAKNEDFISRLLAPYGPQLSVQELVVEVNQIFHAAEAMYYDVRHPEIHHQLPPVWRAMLQHGLPQPPASGWRILDFGCGTGFEAEQILRHLPHGRIAQLTCYDPSPEMLDQCRAKIEPVFPTAVFCHDLSRLPEGVVYNFLATNSLLHHIPDPAAIITDLLPRLTSDAVWLAGHEPSNRFYANPECRATYERFLAEHAWRRFLRPEEWRALGKRVLNLRHNPARRAATEAYRRGLFARKPPPTLIDRLVDFYVAHSYEEASAGRGLNFETMQADFADVWDLTWVKSYSFMGAFFEDDLPGKWARRARELSQKYPYDGANFCTIWRRARAV